VQRLDPRPISLVFFGPLGAPEDMTNRRTPSAASKADSRAGTESAEAPVSPLLLLARLIGRAVAVDLSERPRATPQARGAANAVRHTALRCCPMAAAMLLLTLLAVWAGWLP
jgi:hypothetical protein